MNDLNTTIGKIGPPDESTMAAAQERQNDLTKPRGSLGVLEELSVKLAGIKGSVTPQVGRKVIVVMAGDHGVVEEGVSAFPSEVTRQMVYNFLKGGAGINVISRFVGAEVLVVDMGVSSELEPHPRLLNQKVRMGTANMAVGPAMTRDEALTSLETGIAVAQRVVSNGAGIVGTGDMGIGNTTASSAMVAAFTGLPLDWVVGRGTGINDETWEIKKRVLEQALAANKPDSSDPLDVLAKVGGLEIGGLAGCILGAAASKVPVVIDGFISGAAALLAAQLQPAVVNYLFASHLSVEPGHRLVLERLALRSMLQLDMRLGEGTGAALGMHILDLSAKILSEMATFSEAGVSEAEEAAPNSKLKTKNAKLQRKSQR
jgi:nicotinate-nucleotide--dimethylbenzimidazole phosphoribosyltransferase